MRRAIFSLVVPLHAVLCHLYWTMVWHPPQVLSAVLLFNLVHSFVAHHYCPAAGSYKSRLQPLPKINK